MEVPVEAYHILPVDFNRLPYKHEEALTKNSIREDLTSDLPEILQSSIEINRFQLEDTVSLFCVYLKGEEEKFFYIVKHLKSALHIEFDRNKKELKNSRIDSIEDLLSYKNPSNLPILKSYKYKLFFINFEGKRGGCLKNHYNKHST